MRNFCRASIVGEEKELGAKLVNGRKESLEEEIDDDEETALRDEQEEIDDDEETAIANTTPAKSEQNYSALSYSQGQCCRSGSTRIRNFLQDPDP
jgi:hypothetical protein